MKRSELKAVLIEAVLEALKLDRQRQRKAANQRRYRAADENRRTGPRPRSGHAATTGRSPSGNGAATQRPREEQTEAVSRIWQAYQSHGHERAALTPERRRLIVRRLREGHSEETLIAAIHGMHACPHNQGENEHGQKYLTLEIALRESSKGSNIDRFAEINPGETFPLFGQRTRRIVKAVQGAVDWIDQMEDEHGDQG